MMSSNPSLISNIQAGQGHICEQFLGDGRRHTFDLREVPSSIPAMTARVSRPLQQMSIPLVIGNLRLNTFAGGYDALVDRVGKRIWMFREISICTRHAVRLHTHCPACARSLPHLTWRSRPGYCAFCSGALIIRPEDGVRTVAVDSHEFAWQQWVTHALGAVIARLPGITVEPKRERIRQVMSYAVERLTDGNIVTFTRLLGLPTNTVKNWCQGKRIPELDMLLRLCYRLDLSLCEVLLQEEEMLQPSLRDPVPPALFPSRKRTAINK